MLTSLLSLALAAALPTAQAHDLSVDVGTFGANDSNYEYFSESSQIGTWGFRGGFGFTKNISLVAGWQTGRVGLDVYASGYGDGYEDDYAYGYDDSLLFSTQMTHNRFSLGPKLELPIRPFVSPYVTAQVVGWAATARFDDDPFNEGNLNELTFKAFAPGGIAALGVDLRPIRIRQGMRVATHVEVGYGITGKLRFKDKNARDAGADNGPVSIGDLRFQGLYASAGVGLHF